MVKKEKNAFFKFPLILRPQTTLQSDSTRGVFVLCLYMWRQMDQCLI